MTDADPDDSAREPGDNDQRDREPVHPDEAGYSAGRSVRDPALGSHYASQLGNLDILSRRLSADLARVGIGPLLKAAQERVGKAQLQAIRKQFAASIRPSTLDVEVSFPVARSPAIMTQLADINRTFATWHNAEWASKLAQAYHFDVSQLVPTETWELLRSLPGRLGPANYAEAELSLRQQLRLVRLSADHAVGTCYVLRPERLTSLIDEGKDLVSAEHVDSVLDYYGAEDHGYLVAVLEEVTDGDDLLLPGRAELVIRGSQALLDGHDAAAQSLATCVWDSHLTNLFTRNYISKAKPLARHVEGKERRTIHEFYQAAVFAPAVAAYVQDTATDAYGRNTVVHYARPSQFTRPNAVRAITVAASLLVWTFLHGVPEARAATA
jgi:hypothetical protein